jgi:RHS repeat-associated protein
VTRGFGVRLIRRRSASVLAVTALLIGSVGAGAGTASAASGTASQATARHVPSSALPDAKRHFASVKVVLPARAHERPATPASAADTPPLVPGTITFSEFPDGTSITNQYQPSGIIFGGDSPFITDDGANPTSPVLSGTPQFYGSITGTFVEPDGTARTVDNFSLDVGYIDTPGSTEVVAFDSDGNVLDAEPIEDTGIVNVSVSTPGIASFEVESVDPSNPDPNGWAIDNVAFEGYTFFVGSPDSGEQGGASNPSENPTTCSTAMPVNCATGVFWHQFTDFSVPGRGVPLDLTRTYSASQAAADGPFGFGWTDGYNMSLSTDSFGDVTITQEDGSTVTFAPNGSGGFIAPLRVLATLTQNTDGSYTFVRDQGHIQYEFDAAGQLTSETDLNGYSTTLAYNASGQLATVTDPAGRQLTFSYTGTHVASVTDPMGRAWTYSYDSSGNLVSAVDPLGRTWSFTYDPNHLMLTMTDPRGGTTTNTYNSSDQVVTQVDPDGGTTTWSYSGDPASAADGTTTITDPDGNVTQDQYANFELTSDTQGYGTADAATTSYTYDLVTLAVASVTDPNGNVTTNTYDSDGDLLSTTDPLGDTTSYTYNSLNEPLTKTTPLGETTSYSYDASGNLLTVTDPLGNVTSYAYADSSHPGDITSVTNPDGDVTSYTYDADGDVASLTQSPSAGVTDTTGYAYDADGERTCEASPDATAAGIACPAAGAAPVAGTMAATYNADGEVTSVTDADGYVTSYAYDGDGNQTQVTDATGNVTSYTYNGDNKQTKINRPGGSTQTTTYDADGNVLTQTNGAGAATTYTYNALGQVATSTDPLGNTTTDGYDLDGNRTSVTSADGQVTTYSYDGDSQETAISYSDGSTPGVSYGYDADGQRTSMSDGTGTTFYSYDADDRLTSVTNGAGATVSYGYDAAGLLTSLTYPNGEAVTRTYDSAGELAMVSDWLGNSTTFSYDHDGNVTSEAYPNGVSAVSAYDPAGELVSITDKTSSASLASFSYTRNDLGQVASADETGAVQDTQSYSYTQLSQLAADSGGGYSYDPAGDLTQQPGGVSQAFNADGQLTSGTGPGTVSAPAADQVVSAAAAPSPVEAPATDRVVSASQTSKGATITSPSVTTKEAGELVLAFVSADGPAGHPQKITGVSGGGLAWSLAVRSDGQQGTAEVWQAYATKVLTGIKVTASLQYKGYDGSITVATYTGARTATGSHAAASKGSGAPAVSLTTTGADSLVWAAGEDPSHPAARTAAAGQTLVYSELDAKDKATFWSQRTGPVAAAKTTVKIADTKPAADKWNLAAVEITAAPPAVPAITSPLVTTKAAGELVLAFVSANGPAGKTQQITGVSGGGLTWSLAVRSDAQQGTAEVWQAHAASALSKAQVTASLLYKGYDGSITVATFTGAGNATGAHAAAAGSAGAPAVSLTTTGADSLVWAAGEDPGHATARTAASGQTVVYQAADAAGSDTFWSQQTAPVPSAGTPVQVADTAPTTDEWDLAAVEITAAAAPGSVQTAYGYNGDGDLTSITPTGQPATTLTYNQANQLTGYGAAATYAYDGNGLRMSKTVSGTTTAFAWDQSGANPLLIAAGATYYVYGPGGQPLEQISASTVSYLLSDQQDSTRLITNQAGAVTGTYSYGPYGAVTSHTGTATTALQYDGQYTDAESGLQYLRARYYNPATGQFLTLDPLAALTGEPYGYADDDPVNATDPTGTFTLFGLCVPGWVVPAALTVGAVGLTIINIAQLGLDPVTDAAEAADIGALTLEGGAEAGGATLTEALPEGVASTFTDGAYTQVTTSDATTLYRVYGGESQQLGQYWTTTLPASSGEATQTLALNPAWGNTAEQWVSIEVPSGTTLYQGTAAAQGTLPGGASQVFINGPVSPGWITGGGLLPK